ncbi:MAG TPA: hypothetical protein VGY66_26435 [Gemmataceae bacterium]|jgi:hypothetical protein|nr:hypothetical protein [Gemmataceae bacterium]
MKDGSDRLEKKLRMLNEELACDGNEGFTIAVRVSIGVNLMSRGLIGRRKLFVWAETMPVTASKSAAEQIRVRKMDLRFRKGISIMFRLE